MAGYGRRTKTTTIKSVLTTRLSVPPKPAAIRDGEGSLTAAAQPDADAREPQAQQERRQLMFDDQLLGHVQSPVAQHNQEPAWHQQAAEEKETSTRVSCRDSGAKGPTARSSGLRG